MRVLFLLPQIGSPASGGHAIGTLSAVLKQHGHRPLLYEAKTENLEAFEVAINARHPHVLAVTAVTQQIPYVWGFVGHVAAWHPEMFTILGGVHATLRPNVLHAMPGLDALCVNEGEVPLLGLLENLQSGPLIASVPNLRIALNGETIASPNTFHMTEDDLTNLPFEDRELFPRWRDAKKGESHGLRPRFLFSRGCNYTCTDCSLPALRKAFPAKQFVRYPTVARCFSEIEAVSDRWSFDTFILDDDCPTQRKAWVLEWADKYPLKLRHLQYEVNARVESVDDDVIRALADSGCRTIKFGIESGDEEYRRTVYRRQASNDRIIEAFALADKYGIATKSYNIVGAPNETRRQVWRTIRLNRKVHPQRVQVSIYHPYPCTELGDKTIAQGLVARKVDNYFDHTCLHNPHMAPWEVDLWAKCFRLLVYLAYNWKLAWKEGVGLFSKLTAKLKPAYD